MVSRLRLIRYGLCGLGLLLSTTGCLSLGGGTTYVQEKPGTSARMSALETRVNGLEQAISTMNGGQPVGAPENMPH